MKERLIDEIKLLDLIKEMDAEIIKECDDKGYKAAYRQALINIKGSINSIIANIGKITDTKKESVLIPSIYVGKGDADGVEFELLTTWSQSPMVKVGEKYYQLSWEEILQLADRNGIFEKEDNINE